MNNMRKALSIVFLSVFFLMMIFTMVKLHSQQKQENRGDIKAPENYLRENNTVTQKNSGQVTLSKQAVEDLVDKAAKQKYIQGVFNSDQKLPLPKKSIKLQPIEESENQEKTQSKNVNNLASQRCSYNGQSYVAGDIVKTDQGWMRCTPTFIFSAEKPTVMEYGSTAWTAVQ